MNSWLKDIIEAMALLGGACRYDDLYEKIEEIRSPLPPSWKEIIRRTVQASSSDSATYQNGEDIFYSVEGIGSGFWGLRNYTPTKENVDLTEDDIEFPEGKKKLKTHILRERNPKLVFEAKKAFKKKHNNRLFCEVCDFVFTDKYDQSIAEDFIEAHHIIPISEIDEGQGTKISDLIMVCSNCHRMLHRRRPWLTKENLKSLIIK